MEKYLKQFIRMQIDKQDLQAVIGQDLHNVKCKPENVSREDAINALSLVCEGKRSINQLVDWVNTIWFTDMFFFRDDDAESLISVLEVLETLDEDDVAVNESDFRKMIAALTKNTGYLCDQA